MKIGSRGGHKDQCFHLPSYIWACLVTDCLILVNWIEFRFLSHSFRDTQVMVDINMKLANNMIAIIVVLITVLL